jgi:hypothetical protein
MRHAFPTPKWISSLALIFCVLGLHAQEEQRIMATPPEPRWGFRIDLSGNGTHPEFAALAGATYTNDKHQFYAGFILDPFDARTNSVLFGGSLSYQYFPLRTQKLINPYVYAAASTGKYAIDDRVVFLYPEDTTLVPGVTHTSASVTSALIGIGFEARFGAHCYGNVAAGAGAYYQRMTIDGEFTVESDKTPPAATDKQTTGAAFEIKVGFGYRF